MSNSEPKNAVKLQVPWQNFSSLEKSVFDAANRLEINKRKKLTISIGNSKDSLAVRLATETGPISVPTEQKVAKAQPVEQAAPAIPVIAKEVVEDVAKVEKRGVKEQQEMLPVAKSDDGKLADSKEIKPQILEAKTADIPKMEEKKVLPENVPVEQPTLQISEIKEGVNVLKPTPAISQKPNTAIEDAAKMEKREVKDGMEQQETLPMAKSDEGKLVEEVKPQILEAKTADVPMMEEKNVPPASVTVAPVQVSEIKEGVLEPTSAISQKANTAVEDVAKMEKKELKQEMLPVVKSDDGKLVEEVKPQILEAKTVDAPKMEEKKVPPANMPVEQPTSQILEIKEGVNASELTPAISQKPNTAVEDGAKMEKTELLVKDNTEEQPALAATKTDDERKQDNKISKNLEDMKLPKQEMVDAAKSLQSSKVVSKQVEKIPQTIQKIATETGIQTDDVDDDKTLPLVSYMGFCPFSIGKHKQIKSIQVKPAKNHLK